MNIRLAVGTASKQKLGYLKEVLNELGIEADISSHEVESGVAEQPMTSEETKIGSINRAKNAFQKNKDIDCAIGIEVGYHLMENKRHEIFCWVTVVDSRGAIFSERSRGFILPKFHQKIINDGLYLGDYVREYSKNSDNTVIRHIAETLISRKPFITDALKHALIFYLAKEEF